jgi:MOSC domain-containing protein YiiM
MTVQTVRDRGTATVLPGLGLIAGMARKARVRAPMELIEQAEITEALGIVGDHRGARKPNGAGKRQVTLIERADWAAAMADVGADLPWHARRCNILVDGLDLPQIAGARLLLGRDVVLEVTRCTDPCERMEALAPGLFAALDKDWRGGACARVIRGGMVALGDVIRLEA